MVFVKVRETYDLHTLQNKMSVIGIHTPKAQIIKRNYPGLLMQCKAYRPVSCDVKLACASMLPLDPQGVGLTEGDVAPEDVFNPLLYKAVSNFSMSQIEAFINRANTSSWVTRGDSVDSTNDGLTLNDFNIYYGLLADTHGWRHASPQAGLEMRNLKPRVHELVYNVGDNGADADGVPFANPYVTLPNGDNVNFDIQSFRGDSKPMPWLNCTAVEPIVTGGVVNKAPGFDNNSTDLVPNNYETSVPAPKIYCGMIIVPPSRLHQLFYRLVCEWTLEFSQIRQLSEITSYQGLAWIGSAQHVQDYSFNSKMLTDSTDLVDVTEDSGIRKVM